MECNGGGVIDKKIRNGFPSRNDAFGEFQRHADIQYTQVNLTQVHMSVSPALPFPRRLSFLPSLSLYIHDGTPTARPECL